MKTKEQKLLFIFFILNKSFPCSLIIIYIIDLDDDDCFVFMVTKSIPINYISEMMILREVAREIVSEYVCVCVRERKREKEREKEDKKSEQRESKGRLMSE